MVCFFLIGPFISVIRLVQKRTKNFLHLMKNQEMMELSWPINRHGH